MLKLKIKNISRKLLVRVLFRWWAYRRSQGDIAPQLPNWWYKFMAVTTLLTDPRHPSATSPSIPESSATTTEAAQDPWS